ncbi:four helix bundle protein [Lewinella sp. 4G2]|uniref:four helix bundle protein n=1 Tax=Lewinella sp. 4G2 TaxID=1803372 RepID=UPI0007B4EA3A|nr:four helix bundle protein [Lewinella sp. 4G2]OAV44522.1 four helix bundle protein [Lewinella sp. 4G2]
MASAIFKSWLAYQKAIVLADQIYFASIKFPKHEQYSLTDQMRRSSRSVCANLAEASEKTPYPKHWYSKITDCKAEAAETQVWIEFAYRYKYIDKDQCDQLISLSQEVSRLLYYMVKNPRQFGVKIAK